MVKYLLKRSWKKANTTSMTYKDDFFGENQTETQSCIWFQKMLISKEKFQTNAFI